MKWHLWSFKEDHWNNVRTSRYLERQNYHFASWINQQGTKWRCTWWSWVWVVRKRQTWKYCCYSMQGCLVHVRQLLLGIVMHHSPDNSGLTCKTIRFSGWLEAMCKDVECLFGIVKRRFTLIRCGLRFQTIKKCDQMWLTCCALHNILLMVDGLHES